jgi:hypothetical protein
VVGGVTNMIEAESKERERDGRERIEIRVTEDGKR